MEFNTKIHLQFLDPGNSCRLLDFQMNRECLRLRLILLAPHFRTGSGRFSLVQHWFMCLECTCPECNCNDCYLISPLLAGPLRSLRRRTKDSLSSWHQFCLWLWVTGLREPSILMAKPTQATFGRDASQMPENCHPSSRLTLRVHSQRIFSHHSQWDSLCPSIHAHACQSAYLKSFSPTFPLSKDEQKVCINFALLDTRIP